MSLTENETQGLLAIMRYLSRDDIFSLAKTVVNNLIAFENEQEAISAVLSYTKNPMEFFKRKKIRKEIIFRYAHREGIPNVTPSLSRSGLIKAILQFWGSNYMIEQMDDSDWNDIDMQNETMSPRNYLQQIPTQQNNIQLVPQLNIVSANTSSQQQLQLYQQQEQQQQQHLQNLTNNNVNNFNHALNNNNHIEQKYLERPSDLFNCWLDQTLTPSSEDQQLALEFCKWYYPILNSYATSNSDNTIDTSPYFPDCILHFLMKISNDVNSEIFNSSHEVVARLKVFIGSERINFNPNLNEKGLRCLSDHYGRKVIMVAGTIHQGSNIGLFEQQLGLVRDPTSEYNWKIKFTRLAITSNFLPNQEAILENTQSILNL